MAVNVSFYRNGVAYLYDNGGRVADGAPRFTTGKFAGTRALRIEEGTTNLLTANQSNVETDSSGFSAIGGATGVRDTAFSFEGTASYKITFNATASSGTQVAVVTSTQGTYVGRLRLGLVSSPVVASSIQYHLRINYTDTSLDESITVVTPDTPWLDCISAPVASDAGKTVASVVLMVRQVGALLNGHNIWVDALQIERQTEATTWHIGGGTRNAERALVPTQSLFDPTSGTIEAWIRVEALIESHIVFDTRQLGLSNTGGCVLRVNLAGGDLTFYYWNGSTLRAIDGGTFTAKTWTHVAVTWGPAGGKVYRNGTLITSNSDVPVLVRPPRMSIGGRVDAGETSSGILFGGMRFTKGRVRSNADILTAFLTGTQFTEDSSDSTVFTFNGTLRSLLPPTHRIIAESEFLRPITVTASSTAAGYSALNVSDWEFPLLSHRTTSAAASTLTFDFGDVVNLRAVFIALTNWEGGTLATSVDGSNFVDVAGSPFTCDVDPADQYRKWGAEFSVSGRYAQLTIPTQVTDNGDTYFETPLVIFARECNALDANTNWGMNVTVDYPYQSNDSGSHNERQALGKQFVTMEVHSDAIRGASSNEWQQLATLGNHKKFLFFMNLGNPAESYLMRSDGSVSWEEQSGYSSFSMTWREHIN